jgi:hypothetical protein
LDRELKEEKATLGNSDVVFLMEDTCGETELYPKMWTVKKTTFFHNK